MPIILGFYQNGSASRLPLGYYGEFLSDRQTGSASWSAVACACRLLADFLYWTRHL